MIKVFKKPLKRPIAKTLKPIILPDKFQLRPDGSRDIRSECKELSNIVMKINGMSGQLI